MHSLKKRAPIFQPLLTVTVSCALLLVTGCGGKSEGPTSEPTSGPTSQPTSEPTSEPASAFDLAPFKAMARSASCADITNRLFLIDGKLVFWDIEGNCADGAYAHTLFGGTVDDVLCDSHDSIAGPVGSCQDDAYREMFDTIVANLDKPDLGLGSEHTVEEIPF